MNLSDLLNEDAISLSLKARDKESSIKELVQLLESAHRVDTKGEILSKVLQRESMMSTGIGNGVAIPHGKTRLLKEESVRDSLRASESPAAFLATLREAEAHFLRMEPTSPQPPG